MKCSCRVAVIGAGVVGLSTAICIQNRIPHSSITIYAEHVLEDTLSNGAGGLYRPEISISVNKENVLKWCRESMDHFLELATSEEASSAGMQMVSGYHFSSSEQAVCQNELLRKLLPMYKELTMEEIEKFSPDYKHGVFFTTVITDCRYYLPWLTKKFKESGGKIIVTHIEKISEISDGYDIIINCSGLGAKRLMRDPYLIPVRGQTIKVKAPWIKHFYYSNEVYIVPGIDYVTLGGVKDFGSWTTDVNEYQKQYIWDTCVKLIPSLQNAEIVGDWVGLRPYRKEVCLDSSIIQCEGKLIKVVNNYGHGGHGVTLSWGTAKRAAQLTEEMLSDNFLVSRL